MANFHACQNVGGVITLPAPPVFALKMACPNYIFCQTQIRFCI